jgi:hypothetical protein
MALKFKVKTRDEVPAEMQPLYVERDGAWQLDVEGGVDKSKFDELRTAHGDALKQVKDYEQRFAGINPDEVRKLAEEKQRLEEERQLKAGEVDQVVEKRIKTLKTDWDRELGAVRSERDQLTARLAAIQIDQGVTTAATKRGLRPTAITDITARARCVFKLVDGLPRAFEADGQSVRYGRDGVTPMTLDEWVETQVADAPHLFEGNSGSGAAGNGAAGPGGNPKGVRNPFRKETWNLTEQMRLRKTDPQLAARLKAAA